MEVFFFPMPKSVGGVGGSTSGGNPEKGMPH